MNQPQQKIITMPSVPDVKPETIQLLESHDWMSEGYRDMYEWLRDMYGQHSYMTLLLMFERQMQAEGFL